MLGMTDSREITLFHSELPESRPNWTFIISPMWYAAVSSMIVGICEVTLGYGVYDCHNSSEIIE